MANPYSGTFSKSSSGTTGDKGSAKVVIKSGGAAAGIVGGADVGANRNVAANDDDGGYNWYPSYGYGSGGVGKSAEEQQEETQAQIDNTTANYEQRGKDIDAIAQNQLGNIQKQREANLAAYTQGKRQSKMSSDWQPQQQKEQSVLRALRDRAGNGLSGSGYIDLMEGMKRYDDMSDVQLINTWRENQDNLFDNWYQADTSLVGDYNDQASAIEDEFSKLRSQYWSTISNVNPLLASKENIEKQHEQSTTIGEGTDAYTLPQADMRPSDKLKALLTQLEPEDASNPVTKYYVRPDAAVRKANSIRDTGNFNSSTSANQAVSDNLSAIRSRV
ncbi:MAG: hypothetical protein IIZ12_00495 [Eggerthellaceae bacterium]|nr:hypothetical protein [Eggerthellaceae bacterium]